MPNYDVLIRGAQVIDGTGNPWFYGDVAIKGDRIAAITQPSVIAREQVARVVDATGMVVCRRRPSRCPTTRWQPGRPGTRGRRSTTSMRCARIWPPCTRRAT